ncbi:MAG TPA: glycosyltransferase family 9 protein [Bryobacteraceae bacterium]|nr:glycosyltransferase family 9 protein [Bryobacteraceae bacterium]
MSLLGDLPSSAAAAVIRLRSLGDCVLTTPALSILKQARPDLRIAVVVEERFAPVFTGNPDIERILPPSPALLRAFRPHLCLNLHGGTRSLVLTGASGARFRAGFQHFRYSSAFNVRLPRAQEVFGTERVVHTAEHIASAFFHLGAPRCEIPRASLFADAALLPEIRSPYAVLHPVAATPAKTWRAEGFLAVARHLSRDGGLEPVFIAGPGEDLSSFAEHRTLTGLPLERIKALLSRAALFVGNDSGPAHMAAAFGVPVVALFGPSNATVWAPWRTQSRVLQNKEDITRIALEDVLAACDCRRVTQ